jgi:hypothetical protein
VLAAIYILYQMYLGEISHLWAHGIEFVSLSVKVPKENLVSTMAVESIFGQLHALHTGLTFADIFVEGKGQLWVSLEIISLGGKINYIIRCPKSARDLVEAAIYAQYPNAEVTEVVDYLENVNYDPDNSDFNLWGTEFKLIEDDVIPIRTYREFEHMAAEEKIIEPLAPLYEALAKMQPWEFYGIQIIISPVGDGEWVPRGQAKVKQLIGEDMPHEHGFMDVLMTPLNFVAHFSFKDMLLGGGHGHGHGHDDGGKPKNNLMFMTPLEKERAELIERKIARPGYKTKIRHMYMAPKDKYDGGKKALVIGAYRPLGSAMTNQFKPDTKKTWTSPKYMISPTLEKALYLDKEERRRKVLMFKGFKNRDIHLGNPMFIMNTEELAILYHFPMAAATMTGGANIEKIESKKSQAPANLPIFEE